MSDVAGSPAELPGLRGVIGVGTITAALLYLVSDLVELAQDGFSSGQLAMTYAAEAAVPFSVLGLWALQRPAMGWLGLLGAAGYAYTFVFFPGTVVYALVRDVADWQALQDDLGAWLTVHGILMVVTGGCFAVAVVRAAVLPRWTGVALFLGLALIAVASGMSDVARTAAAGVRDLAFVGMGAAVLRSPTWP